MFLFGVTFAYVCVVCVCVCVCVCVLVCVCVCVCVLQKRYGSTDVYTSKLFIEFNWFAYMFIHASTHPGNSIFFTHCG